MTCDSEQRVEAIVADLRDQISRCRLKQDETDLLVKRLTETVVLLKDAMRSANLADRVARFSRAELNLHEICQAIRIIG